MALGLGIVYVAAALIYAGVKDKSFSRLLLGRDEQGSGGTLADTGASPSSSQGAATPPFGSGSTSSTLPSSPGDPTHGFLPRGAAYTGQRADHGRDFVTTPGGGIIAPGAGSVVQVGNDPSGFGPSYPVVRFTSGPYAGRTLYIGHTYSQLRAGARFAAGQLLALTDPRKGVGSATTPGWVEIGYGVPGGAGYGYGQPPF